METNYDPVEEARFEALVLSINSRDRSQQDEAFEEAGDLIKKRDPNLLYKVCLYLIF